jgi:hypothetical protein
MASPQIDELGERLGIVPAGPGGHSAGVRPQLLPQRESGRCAGHNERLEFLGDAVIGHGRQPPPLRPLPEEDEGR